jgi:signal transduction histidine kinase
MALPSPERIRIAQELHDGIAQDLVAIGYSLDLALSEAGINPSARARIRATRLEVDELMAKVRAEILNLRSSNSTPLHARIERLVSEIGAEAETKLLLEPVQVSDAFHEELIVILTEILRNCSSHSRASHIEVKLYSINNRTCLEVIDNGIGGAHVKEGRYGIQGLIERVEALGGSITIESIDGTRVAILI